jgi:uncharacterized membrane protein
MPGADDIRGGISDIEAMLRNALQPVEPPEQMVEKLEQRLSVVADQANQDLASWREELSESELRSLRDPRNWVRPAAAGAASVAAGAALVVLGLRRRTPDTKAVESSLRQLADDAQRLADEARRRLP